MNTEIDSSSSSSSSPLPSYVIVARHGERLDYVMRDNGDNWLSNAERPWDPPLSEHGKEQGFKLGRHLAEHYHSSANMSAELQRVLPPISAIYSSPFLRCRQTAASALRGIQMSQTDGDSNSVVMSCPKVKVEMGLAESINDNWYRSWSLLGSDGTWGYNRSLVVDSTTTLRSEAKQPVQTLLDWKFESTGNIEIQQYMDLEYESRTSIDTPYTFYPQVMESKTDQRKRMLQTIEALSEPGKTIFVVSHGGPVTHLYEELTGNPWYVHGESTYCCYSIYKRRPSITQPGSTEWDAVVVNESSFLQEKLVPERHVSNV